MLLGRSDGALERAAASDPLSFGETCVIADVVFPSGIDRRDDIGAPDRFDVYYGMADNRWPTTELAWLALMHRMSCQREDLPTRRKGSRQP